MSAIIIALIQVLGTIIVAIFTYFTNHRIQKLSDVKSEIRNDIEKNRLEDIERHNETLRKLAEIETTVDENDIDVVRSRIVSFENLCRMDIQNNNIKLHQYKTIFKDLDKWRYYHTKYKTLNGEIDVAIDSIREHYRNAKF